MFKCKKIVVLVRKFDNNYFKLKTIKIYNETKNLINFKQKTYNINLSKPCFFKKNKPIYVINIDTNDTLVYNEIKSLISPEEFNMLLNQTVMNRIVNSMKLKTAKFPFEFLLGLIVGILGGLIIAFVLVYTGVLVI